MSTDGTDGTGGIDPADGFVGARARRPRRRLGLGAFDEQIADLTPPGHERVEIDPAPTAGTVETAEAQTVETVGAAGPTTSGDTAGTGEAAPATGTADPPASSDVAGRPDPAPLSEPHGPSFGPPGPFGLEDGVSGESEELPAGDPTADTLVGRTGARFNSRARRSRRERERRTTQDSEAADQDAPEAERAARGPRHESNGHVEHADADDASTDRSATPRREEPPTVPFVPEPVAADGSGTAAPTAGSAGSGPVIAEAGRRTDVRPYIRTNGRTRPRTELALETMVSLPSPRPAMDDPEHLAIGELCDGPRSVAEVAALLSLPLGVARVLIDDMAVEGLLRVHSTAGGPHAGPDLSVLERVLSGLHRL